MKSLMTKLMKSSTGVAGSGLACPADPARILAYQQNQQGFTLIELMLALALTALLLGMLSGGVYSVVRDWDNNAAGLDATLDETIAILQIERALQGAFPHSYRDTESLGRFVYFEGDENSIGWVSAVSPQRGTGLIAWRLYSVRGEGVYLQLAPALSDYPGTRLSEAEPLLLLQNYTAQFSYLNEVTELSREWEFEWNGADQMQLPLAVHVLLTPIESDSRRKPLDIVAGVHANQHRSLRPTNASAQPVFRQGPSP
jgi:general secretion pathway protein J